MEGWVGVARGCLIPLAFISFLVAVVAIVYSFTEGGFSYPGVVKVIFVIGVGTALIVLSRSILKKSREPQLPLSLSLKVESQMTGLVKSPASETRGTMTSDDREIMRFTRQESETLRAVKEDVARVLARDDLTSLLDNMAPSNIVLTNKRLQPIAFALRPTTASQYFKGIVLEAFTWCKFSFCLIPISLVSHYLSFTIARTAFSELLYSARISIREARRYRIGAHNKLRRDPRDPILYLRSFSSEYANNPDGNNPKTAEETLADFYRDAGPMIAIGQPNEQIPLLGPLRLYFDDANELIWKAGVLYLMTVAKGVIISAGIAPGLLWELGVARKKLAPERLYISLHGWADLDPKTREEHYLRFKKYADVLLECNLPPYDGVSYTLAFGSGWQPRLR